MRNTTLRIAEKFSAKEFTRPALSGIKIEDKTVLATDTFKAIRITEKASVVNIPDSINELMDNFVNTEKWIKIDLEKFHRVIEGAVRLNFDKRNGFCIIHFKENKTILRTDGFIDKEFSVPISFGFTKKLNGRLLYEVTKELTKQGFESIIIIPNKPEQPLGIYAEHNYLRIESILMPIK